MFHVKHYDWSVKDSHKDTKVQRYKDHKGRKKKGGVVSSFFVIFV